jgi:hypothetical protein
MNLPILVKENDILESWVGKPKGKRQVLWEQGLLDPAVTYVSKIKKMIQIMKQKWNTVLFLQTVPIS